MLWINVTNLICLINYLVKLNVSKKYKSIQKVLIYLLKLMSKNTKTDVSKKYKKCMFCIAFAYMTTALILTSYSQ